MGRRWLHSLDLETDGSGRPLVETALVALAAGAAPPTSLAGGTKTVAAAATPEKLVATATACRFVWLGARCDANGVAQNTKPVFLGDSAGQNVPIMPTNFEGVVIQVDDASKLYVKVGASGEGVAYRIFA